MTNLNAWATGDLLAVGVNHHTAPVEIRERLALDPIEWRTRAPSVPQLLLSTCNRTEVYVWDSAADTSTATRLANALAAAAGFAPDALAPHLFVRRGQDAAVHLVRVATGLDSLVLGEAQIIGQLRSALRLAREHGTSTAPLEGVVGRSLEAGRRIRAATLLGRRPSVASAAVLAAQGTPELAATGLAGRPAIVLGAGAMARSAAQALLSLGAQVRILNRTFEHAARLASQLGRAARPAAFETLPELCREASVLVAATGAHRAILDAATLQAAVAERMAAPLVVLDLGVPRNIDPAARDVAGVRLIDLDDLERLCPIDAAVRDSEVQRAEALALEAGQAISEWLRIRAMSPVIVELRRQGDAIRTLELRRAARQLDGLTPEQFSAVDQLTEAIVNKLLHGPTVALREAAAAATTPGLDASRRVLDLLRLDRGRHAQRGLAAS